MARLEAFGPDLIFNTAEGRRGRFREAFFPALFDELGAGAKPRLIALKQAACKTGIPYTTLRDVALRGELAQHR